MCVCVPLLICFTTFRQRTNTAAAAVQIKFPGGVRGVRAGTPCFLRYKRYLHDPAKSMAQAQSLVLPTGPSARYSFVAAVTSSSSSSSSEHKQHQLQLQLKALVGSDESGGGSGVSGFGVDEGDTAMETMMMAAAAAAVSSSSTCDGDVTDSVLPPMMMAMATSRSSLVPTVTITAMKSQVPVSVSLSVSDPQPQQQPHSLCHAAITTDNTNTISTTTASMQTSTVTVGSSGVEVVTTSSTTTTTLPPELQLYSTHTNKFNHIQYEEKTNQENNSHNNSSSGSSCTDKKFTSGLIESIKFAEGENAAIVSGAFGMEENIRRQAGADVVCGGIHGTLVGPFAKLGKCKIRFPSDPSIKIGARVLIYLLI